MNNNNPNSSSPLDEIKRITKENSVPNPRRRVPGSASAQNRPASSPKSEPVVQKPAPAVPQQRTAPVQKKPEAALSKPEEVKAPTRTAPAPQKELSAADTVKPMTEADISRAGMARQATPTAPSPRVAPRPVQTMNGMSASDVEQLKTEIPHNTQSSASVKKSSSENSQTRISDTVPAVKSEKERPNMKTDSKKPSKAPAKSGTKVKKKAPAKKSASSKGSGGGNSVLSNTVKAIIYIVSVFVISGCLSLFVIFVGNDCFAFVKPDVDIEITIPKDADLGDIAKILHKNDIIKYPQMFKLYINIRGKDSDTYLSGKFTVNGSMSYDSLISQFKPYSTREEVTVTIVEGMTTKEIIDMFVNEYKIGTEEGFEKAINEYEYDFWFLEDLPSKEESGRFYRLDGYLFPDTYNFFTDAHEEDVIYKLLDNFDKKFDKDNIARLEELGMSLDEIVTLASMIQKEAKYVNNNPHADNGSDYALVSAVFHNRLNNPNYDSIGGKLQSDATVKYSLDYYEDKTDLAEALHSYDTVYNTYMYPGLPAGPICSPSLNAINFAMNPDMISGKDYYYFISNSQGYNYYATTSAEHEKNVQKVKDEGTED